MQNGDALTLHMNTVELQATRGAFAAILGDGTAVTWGDADFGGDSSAVQHQLKNVQHRRGFRRHSRRWIGCDLG